MNTKVLLLLALVAVAVADKRPQYDPDPYDRYDQDRYDPYDSDEDEYEPYDSSEPKYHFDYAVKDKYGNDFGHEETRDGDYTKGSYYVLLSDGRLQKVDYSVDGYSGYEAEVTYEGEAHYDSYESKEYGKPKKNPSHPPRYESDEFEDYHRPRYEY